MLYLSPLPILSALLFLWLWRQTFHLPKPDDRHSLMPFLTLLITPGATAERLSPRPGVAMLWSIAIALLCTLGGITLSLLTNAPVSVFVTSLSFASYLVARFAVGPALEARASRGIVVEAT